MADLTFQTQLEWQGVGETGEGTALIDDEGTKVIYSAPQSMGGKGIGSSPEQFLMSAVSSCYSITVFRAIQKAGLPIEKVSVAVEGVVTGYPLSAKFAKIVVQPTIHGGDAARQSEYEHEAKKAKARCFIGQTIIGNVDYELGEVVIA